MAKFNKIDLSRLQELINGDGTPANKKEELFVLGYSFGINGQLFITALNQVVDEWETFEWEETTFFVFGYAMGQRTLEESDGAAVEDTLEKTNKKTFH